MTLNIFSDKVEKYNEKTNRNFNGNLIWVYNSTNQNDSD